MRSKYMRQTVFIQRASDNEPFEGKVMSVFKELGTWFYRIETAQGIVDIPTDIVSGIFHKKKAKVLKFRTKLKLVK